MDAAVVVVIVCSEVTEVAASAEVSGGLEKIPNTAAVVIAAAVANQLRRDDNTLRDGSSCPNGAGRLEA